MKTKPILKLNLEETLVKLANSKQQEYKKRFSEIISTNNPYQSLPQAEKNDLIDKLGCLALNVVSSIDWTLSKNGNSERALKYLEDIQKSDGTMETSFYVNLVTKNLIEKDGLSSCLIRVLSNNDESKKEGLSFYHALPDNLDDKPYKGDYIQFCTQISKEIMAQTIEISRQKLAEAKDNKGSEKRSISWSAQVTADKSSSPKNNSAAT